MASRKIVKILADKSVLFLCDMQEGFRKTIKYFPQILEVSNRMLGASKALDIPVVVTEQYPKGGQMACGFDSAFVVHLYSMHVYMYILHACRRCDLETSLSCELSINQFRRHGPIWAFAISWLIY
jgi:hypothetical protein